MISKPVSKRDFLKALGAVAGTGALWQGLDALGLSGRNVARAATPNLNPGSGQGRSVIILGAGVSGLTAAWELSKAGWNCTVLEASDRAGGRNHTARGGDTLLETGGRQEVRFGEGDHLYANMGPARIPHHHRAYLDYCKEFGIGLEVFTNDNRAAFHHNPDSFGGQAVPARQVVSDLRGYIAELLAKAAGDGALDGELTKEDRQKLLDVLVSFGGLDKKTRAYGGSNRAGYRSPGTPAGMKKGEINAPLDFQEILGSDFWQYKLHFGEFYNQAPTMLQPIGGMDAIVRAFERRVGSLVRYDRVVREIRKTPGGVRIVHGSRAGGPPAASEADFAICTIPGPVLKDIPNDFAPETRTAIASLDFVPAVKIAFQARRRFWEEDDAIYGGISWTSQDITQIWYPAYGYHQRNGIVMGAYIWDDKPALRYSGMQLGERLEAAMAEGEAFHKGYGSELETGVSRAWVNAPFQKGGWRKGGTGPDALLQPDGAIYFAGDQVSALSGWQEGAILAAHAAVNAINEKVMKK